MSFFIFSKDLDNITGTLSRIAENEFDLNNLNIMKSVYKIIEESQENFNFVKFNKKYPLKYNGDIIVFEDSNIYFEEKIDLFNYIETFKKQIKNFLELNPQSLVFDKWNNYYNQLNNLNLNTIEFPLNKSLEEYFNDLGQPSLSHLQLP
jgi:hypothetical protein